MRTKKRRTNKTKNRYFTRRRRGTKKIIRRKKRTKARTAIRTKKARKQRNYHRHRGNYRRGNYRRRNYRGGNFPNSSSGVYGINSASVHPFTKTILPEHAEQRLNPDDPDEDEESAEATGAELGAEATGTNVEGAELGAEATGTNVEGAELGAEGTGTNVEGAELGAEGTGTELDAVIEVPLADQRQADQDEYAEGAEDGDGDAKTENENPIVITGQELGSNTKSEQPVTGVTGAVTGVPLADKEQSADLGTNQDADKEQPADLGTNQDTDKEQPADLGTNQDTDKEQPADLRTNQDTDVLFAQPTEASSSTSFANPNPFKFLEKEEVKKAQSDPEVLDVQQEDPPVTDQKKHLEEDEPPANQKQHLEEDEPPANQEPPAEVKEIIDIKAQPLEKAQSSPAQGDNGLFNKVGNFFSKDSKQKSEVNTEGQKEAIQSQKAIPVTNPSGENTDENPPTDITGKKDGDQNTTDQIEQPSSKKSRRKKRNRGKRTKKKKQTNNPAAAAKQEQPQAPKQEQPAPKQQQQAAKQQQQAANLKDKPKGPKSNKKTFNKKTRKNRGPFIGPRTLKGTKRKENRDYNKKIDRYEKEQAEYYETKKNHPKELAKRLARKDKLKLIDFDRRKNKMKELNPDKTSAEVNSEVKKEMIAEAKMKKADNDLWYENTYERIQNKLSSEDPTFKELSDEEKKNRIETSEDMILAKKERKEHQIKLKIRKNLNLYDSNFANLNEKEQQDKVNERYQRTESKKENNRGNKTGNNNTRRSGPRPQGRPQGKQTRRIPKEDWDKLTIEKRKDIIKKQRLKQRWTPENREEYKRVLAKLMEENNVEVATREMKKKASEIADEKFPQKITRKAKTPRQGTKKSPKKEEKEKERPQITQINENEKFPPLANAEQPQQPATKPSFAAALAKKKSSPPKKSQSPKKSPKISPEKYIRRVQKGFLKGVSNFNPFGGTRKKAKKTKKT